MTSVQTDGLDDYNPFTGSYRADQPAIMKTGDIDNGARSKTNESTSLISSTKSIQSYRQSRTNSEQKPHGMKVTKTGHEECNWPKIPPFCPCQPCFYQDICNDIPESMQQLVRAAYYLWMWYSITMMFNIFGTMSYFLTTGSMEAGSTFGMSIIMLIVLPVLTFLGWYRPLYKAAKFDSSVSYFIYFLTSFGLVIVTSIQCVGINWLGACGWLNGTIVVVTYRATGVLMLIIATFFSIVLTGQIVLLIKVHQKYRNIDPLSVSQSKDELKTDLKKSESLREIARASMKSGTNYILEDIRDKK